MMDRELRKIVKLEKKRQKNTFSRHFRLLVTVGFLIKKWCARFFKNHAKNFGDVFGQQSPRLSSHHDSVFWIFKGKKFSIWHLLFTFSCILMWICRKIRSMTVLQKLRFFVHDQEKIVSLFLVQSVF